MRARRSRSQHARRWERGRPTRNPDHARKKPTPLSPLDNRLSACGVRKRSSRELLTRGAACRAPHLSAISPSFGYNTNCRSRVHNYPPPAGSPRFARGTKPRAHLVPLRAGGTLRRGSSLSLIFANYGCAIGIVSVFALVFQHAPLPTSPVDGGGATTPSPRAGRVGVGAMFKSHCKDT